MNLQIFKAPTMAECLGQVRQVMGREAIILHTRTYPVRRWLGLRRNEVVEITASRSMPGGSRPGPRTGATIRTVESSSLATATLPAPAVLDPVSNVQKLLETPAAGTAVLLDLSRQVSSLTEMMNQLRIEQRQTRAPQIPQELFEYYTQLTDNQVAAGLAEEIIRSLQKQIRPEHLSQPQFVRDKLADLLEKMLPSSGPIVRTKTHGAHVVALIGPTGVGKTTTIAKLAANLKLRENHRVGLITIDTYRIAAIDQLKKYADIIGSPLKVVGNAEDLRDAVAAMHQTCDFILIDTAGRSPNDTLKLNELKNFLAAAAPDEVHLVLSTTASEECVEMAIERFESVHMDKIIFTKIDEAKHVGMVLNVIRKVNKSLSYITTGQDVPDDIEVGRGRRLAQLILGSSL